MQGSVSKHFNSMEKEPQYASSKLDHTKSLMSVSQSLGITAHTFRQSFLKGILGVNIHGDGTVVVL